MDIHVLENSLLPVAYSSRNPHIFSSPSPRMECVHWNDKVSQHSSCSRFKQDTKHLPQPAFKGEVVIPTSQLYLSEFSCLHKLILAASIHHLLLGLASCSSVEKKKGVSLVILTVTLQECFFFLKNPNWKLEASIQRSDLFLYICYHSCSSLPIQ